MARIQGTVLSILFARAISRAPALQGLTKSAVGFGLAGEPGWVETTPPLVELRREGDRSGDEKDRRYSAMKKTSFRAQNTNRTVCDSSSAYVYCG